MLAVGRANGRPAAYDKTRKKKRKTEIMLMGSDAARQ